MSLPSVFDEIDRLFDELMHRWGARSRKLVPSEVQEVKDGWVIRLTVEGLRAGDLHVEVNGQQLTISGQQDREQEKRHGETGWSRTRQQTQFRRTMMLPAEADPDSIEATIEGSTLSIHVRRRRR